MRQLPDCSFGLFIRTVSAKSFFLLSGIICIATCSITPCSAQDDQELTTVSATAALAGVLEKTRDAMEGMFPYLDDRDALRVATAFQHLRVLIVSSTHSWSAIQTEGAARYRPLVTTKLQIMGPFIRRQVQAPSASVATCIIAEMTLDLCKIRMWTEPSAEAKTLYEHELQTFEQRVGQYVASLRLPSLLKDYGEAGHIEEGTRAFLATFGSLRLARPDCLSADAHFDREFMRRVIDDWTILGKHQLVFPPTASIRDVVNTMFDGRNKPYALYSYARSLYYPQHEGKLMDSAHTRLQQCAEGLRDLFEKTVSK